MAGEITALEYTGGSFQVLFLYPIAVPKQVGGQNVVPTPSAGLPAYAAQAIDAAEVSALDAGTMAYEVLSFRPDPSLTAPQLLARVQAIYADRLAEFTTEYANRFQRIGQRFDAV